MKKNTSLVKNKRKASLANKSNIDLLQNKNGPQPLKKPKEYTTINNTIGINLTINNQPNQPKQLKNQKFTSNREIFLDLAFKSKSKERLQQTYSKELLEQNIGLRSITPLKIRQPSFKKQKPNFIILDRSKLNINKRNYSNNLILKQKKEKINLDNINSNLNEIFHSSFSNTFGYEDNKINNQEEILEYKLVNNRLKNEIQILTEKNKSLNDLIEIKNKDIEILKNKNNALYFETNMEINLLKEKYEKNYILTCKKYERSIKIINSMINVVIELCDFFFNIENNTSNNFLTNNCYNVNTPKNKSVIDFSLDIYENNNNNNNNNSNSFADIISPNFNNNINLNEQKNQLLKKIKEIIIEKINYITNELEIILDSKTIEKLKKIRSWNYRNISPTFSFKNFRKSKSNGSVGAVNNNNNISNNEDCSISKIQTSINDVDGFDFSVSKSFYKESHNSQEGSSAPKFNKSNTIKEGNNPKITGNIFGEDKSLGISFESAKINEEHKQLKETSIAPGKITNLLEYSMADLVEAIDSKGNKNKIENSNNEKLVENENVYKINDEIVDNKKNNDDDILKEENNEKNKETEDKVQQLNEKIKKKESNYSDGADVNNFTLKDS